MKILKQICLNFLLKSQSKAKGFAKGLFDFLIHFYQMFLSGIFGGTCKFYPSCSHYAKQATRDYPTIKASKLIFKRLGKCHPFNSAFGYDPVPTNKESFNE